MKNETRIFPAPNSIINGSPANPSAGLHSHFNFTSDITMNSLLTSFCEKQETKRFDIKSESSSSTIFCLIVGKNLH